MRASHGGEAVLGTLGQALDGPGEGLHLQRQVLYLLALEPERVMGRSVRLGV